MYLTKEQIDEGAKVVFTNDPKNTLSPSQISDLLSIFRDFLGPLAEDYPIEDTLTALVDTAGADPKCAKLAACLMLFQENQFTPTAGFAPTAANRTGFHYSLDGEVFKIFKYAFGLFWPIPAALSTNASLRIGSRRSSEGKFLRRGI